MGIENIMYFMLGLLLSGLVALIILPAVWRRAVRLTKRRIQAATPLTLAEFRADKDQLRAQFALSTRRLEMRIEKLRARLAAQLSNQDQDSSDLGALHIERAEQLELIAAHQAYAATLEDNYAQLEQHAAALTTQLRDYDDTNAQAASAAARFLNDADLLTGNYSDDITRLITVLEIERQRRADLGDQLEALLFDLEARNQPDAIASKTTSQLRDLLASLRHSDQNTTNLASAEARMASAETQLTAILADTEQPNQDNLSPGEQLDHLRQQLEDVQTSILNDWDDEPADPGPLRTKLDDIATNVSRMVYAVDAAPAPSRTSETSLFDRVQRFAESDEDNQTTAPEKRKSSKARPAKPANNVTQLADRKAALREIRGH